MVLAVIVALEKQRYVIKEKKKENICHHLTSPTMISL